MKELKIILAVIIIFSSSFVFTSCSEDDEIFIKATLELEESAATVPYTEGELTVGVTANDDYNVTVYQNGIGWLDYEILNEGDSLKVFYTANDSTLERTGRLILINDDVMRFYDITQEGIPTSSITKIDIDYAVNSSGGYTIFSVSEQECNKIPIGATLVIDCGDAGTISLLDASYNEYMGGSPVNGSFSFVWTQEIANTTASGGITTGVLRDGFEVNAVYAIYTKGNIEYAINSQGGYTILSVSAEECAKIPKGANVIFECPSDDGTVSLLDASYNAYVEGSPVNGFFSFSWTSAIAGITESAGITTGILRDGFDVSSMYFTSVINDLEYTINDQGGYTILSVSAEECAKIPIGATLVFECPSDDGTISLLDSNYQSFAEGGPVNGEFSFVWTKEIAAITATSGISTGVIRDGFDITAMYCHN